MWHVAGIEVVERNHALVFNMFFWASLAFLVLTLRLYTRAFVIRQIGADDYLMVGAMVASIAWVIGVVFQIKYGLGRPVEQVIRVPFLQSLFGTVPMYNLAQTCYKLSITIQSYRLFSTDNSKRILKGLFIWITLCGIVTVIGSFAFCYPVAKAWNPSIKGSCANQGTIYYTSAALNILNDVFLTCLPFPFLLKLQVARKHRLVLCSVFSCGVLVTIVSICRLKFLHENFSAPPGTDNQSSINAALWSILEINLAIICGSVPALKGFVSRVLLGKKSTSYVSEVSSRSRRKTRCQSQTLPSILSGEELDIVDASPVIEVTNSYELKTYCPADDDGSEKDLVAREDPAYRAGNVTVISGPSRAV